MKQTSLVVFLAVLVGIGLGWGTTYAKYGIKGKFQPPFTERMISGTDPPKPWAPPENGPKPRIMIDQEEFDFGKVEAGARARHAFKISNLGNYPLVIESGGTSCGKCTFSDLEHERVIAPSGSSEVTVSYEAAPNVDHFRQGAILKTNDPLRSNVTLVVTGKLEKSYTLVPDRLAIGEISANEERTVELQVLANLIDDLRVSDPEFLGKNSAEYFQAEIQPLPADRLPTEAKSGALVKIIIKPGLPLGAVRQTIRLATNLAGREELDVAIDGTIDGDLSFIGPKGFDEKTKVLNLGVVSAKEGSQSLIMMVVRGPHRYGVEFKFVKSDPQWLKAEVGATVPSSTSAVRAPLTITIPQGSPPAVRMGNAQGRLGVIELESNHPQAKQFKVFVQFAVEP